MDNKNKINKLVKRLIDISTVEGAVDEPSLMKGIAQIKASGFSLFIPLLKALRIKLKRVIAWQTAEVSSPTDLSSESIDSLKVLFSSMYNRPIQVIAKMDPSLIAGIQVKVGDDVYDASIVAHLKKISEANNVNK